MTQEETIQIFRNYFAYIKRPGAADLLQWMDANGFFEAPASKRHHGAEPGGLAQHSINVCRRLIQMNAEEERRQQSLNYDLETLAICGLLHDLCKIDAYRKAEFEGITEYRLTKNFPAGHGEKSVILILQFMHLTQEEILAIRWHMGQYDFYARGGGYDLDNAFHQCKLAVMLHLADMMATHFDEREEEKSGEKK
ncbi:HD domain-containing protein [Otoolea muris]|uniref:HD domain-containing protein n=1 Tax=Otoolea muris TaxID=2941515 RepID=UPI00203E601B|nr:TraI domain-containing protein [Otoolea muris]